MTTIVRRLTVLSTIVLLGAVLAGCPKPPLDPVEQCRILLPKITEGINKHDLAALKELGTDAFDPNVFVRDVFAHGYSGEVTLAFQRYRSVPGESRLVINVEFGQGQSGGVKELTLYLAGDKKLKIDTYSLSDIKLPSGKPGPGAVGTQIR